MGLCLLVGIFVSAGAADAVTGLVAGVGAGGIVALRADAAHGWRMRAAGVAVAAAYTFVLARSAGADGAGRCADLPLHQPRPRRPPRPSGGWPGRRRHPRPLHPSTGDRRASTGRVPRRLPVGCRHLGLPDRRRRRPRWARSIDLGHLLRHPGQDRGRRRRPDGGRPPEPHGRGRGPAGVARRPGLPVLDRVAEGHARPAGAPSARTGWTSTGPSSTSSSAPGWSRWPRSTTGISRKRSRTTGAGRPATQRRGSPSTPPSWAPPSGDGSGTGPP